MYTADDLIKIALNEVGYLEKKTNDNLDDKTANAGYNNRTKYARDLANAGYYQASKQGTAWCDIFVDWCHYIASGKDAKLAQDVICQTGLYGAGCGYSMKYYKQARRLYLSNPQPGDQIFFGTSKEVTHTGIVYKVENGRVYTVEGNTSSEAGVVANGGGVFKKSYVLNYKSIVGYGRPKYAEEPKKEAPEATKTTTTGVCNVELNILRNGSKGTQVKALQTLLIGYGYKCGFWGADGNFGASTDAAVRKFQKNNGLAVDGAVGPATWSKLLGTK